MPDPKPNGNYASRATLRGAVYHKRYKGKSWAQIGKETGISARAAKECFSEEEAIRRAGRELAYQLATGRDPGNSQPGALPTDIALLLMVVIAIVAAFALVIL